ncbi:MAG: 2-C-methyl-D-erythritol 2,4-cyclodiphosphate synthase [Candidatus Latescibacterota bacterium]|nr:MAG: 2-C-methyl-D-erythritol 2,4-cyclodiphosphate synthase [Candidatus Latescibacterota bacterium]
MKSPRIGIGFDSHRFVSGKPLVLGGVAVPYARGLEGHSDADVLLHALIDALLGAAGAGDIGRLFPDDDPAWRGASSLDFLSRACEEVRRRGFRVGNVDVVVIAEEPRIAPHAADIRRILSAALRVPEDAVSVKGKSNEGMGAIGRREGIAAQAIALLLPDDPA